MLAGLYFIQMDINACGIEVGTKSLFKKRCNNYEMFTQSSADQFIQAFTVRYLIGCHVQTPITDSGLLTTKLKQIVFPFRTPMTGSLCV